MSKIPAAINLSVRPTFVSSPTITEVCEVMHASRRDDLVHYAGACYRDDHAWQMVLAWQADPTAPEDKLKRRVLKLR